MIENWVKVKGNEDYLVSDMGFVRSFKGGVLTELKTHKRKDGYYEVKLTKDGISKTQTVHTLVVKSFMDYDIIDKGLVVDHININRGDNRLSNLRVITHRENISRSKKGTSKHTGVHWSNANNKWVSRIQINKKRVTLGLFTLEDDAHNAYQKKLKEISDDKKLAK